MYPSPRLIGFHLVQLPLHVRDLLSDPLVFLDGMHRTDVQELRAEEKDLRDEIRRRRFLVGRMRVERVALLLRRVDLGVFLDIDSGRATIVERVDLVNLAGGAGEMGPVWSDSVPT
jgi:hypothetical protein